jgi:hypothetical protein
MTFLVALLNIEDNFAPDPDRPGWLDKSAANAPDGWTPPTQCRELVALADHRPSRSADPGAGPEATSGYRMTAGETLGYWHERIREVKGPDVAVIALGDFNDDPFDRSVSAHAVALRERGDVLRADSAKLYNLAWRYLTQDVIDHEGNPRTLDGTLYHDGDGAVFDQILVSPGLLSGKSGLKVLDDTAKIEAFPEMVDHRVSFGPRRFGLPKGNAAKNVTEDGFSDHFPVSVRERGSVTHPKAAVIDYGRGASTCLKNGR